MATRRWILYLLPAATIAVLAGCGSNSTFNVQNPPPPPAQTLSIEFTPASTGVVQVPINSTANFTATVTNDPSNEGVEWALLPTTCQTNAAPCGTLSAQYTPSGTSVTYTPPSSISGNNLNVIVAAYAKADQTHNALAQVDVTAFGSNLSGTYVLEAQGADSSFYPYQFAGLIFLDGNGNITAGQQTVNFFDNTPTVGAQVSDTNTITGGSYFLGPDGRGTITINTTNSDIGPESFSFVFLSSSQALIAALPTSSLAISGTGTMDLQDPKYQATPHPTPPPGGYAFMTNGTTGGVPQAFGGILDIDSSNNVVESDSVMDQYVAINGMGSAPVWNNARPTGSVSNTSTFGGVITLALNVPAFSNSNPTPTFTGYIVDDNHIKLIENDGASSTVGLAIAQGSDAGTFSDASFSGTYAFGVTGADLDNVNSPPAATTLASAGVFSVDGAGDLNGFTDTLLQSNTFAGVNGNCTVNGAAPNGAQISTTFDGATYSVDNAGLGRFAVSLESFSPQPVCKGYASHFLFYLTGNDTAALVLEVGSANYPFLGTGIAYLQSTSPTFPDPTPNNMYGFSFTQQNGSEYDGTALMTANPTATPPSLSGTVDNNIGVGQSFTGTFTLPPGCSVSPSSSGCFAGTFSNVNNNAFVGVPPSGDTYAFTADFFVIDADHGFFVETDLLTQQTPQVSFGYYACRDSVTGQPTCPTAQQSDKRSTVLHR